MRIYGHADGSLFALNPLSLSGVHPFRKIIKKRVALSFILEMKEREGERRNADSQWFSGK